jgi:hypothetical protein
MDLDGNDINHIIHSLRTKYGPILFGDCGRLVNPSHHNEAVLSGFSILPKNSASSTDVMFASARIDSQTPFKIVIKMWFGWDDLSDAERRYIVETMCPYPCDDIQKQRLLDHIAYPSTLNMFETIFNTHSNNYKGLDYEARVYSYITENIIMKNISPTFIPLLSANECDIPTVAAAIASANEFTGKKQLLKKMDQFYKLSDAKLKLKFLITGSGKNTVTLDKYLTENYLTVSTEDIACIFFQLLYSLYIFQKYNIVHGDLHFGNILVQTLENPIVMRFDINGNIIKFKTQLVIKIYDYDFSYIDGLGVNLKIENTYAALGIGVGFRKNADFFKVLCGFGSYMHEISAIRVILSIFQLYYKARAFSGTSDLIRRGEVPSVVTLPYSYILLSHIDSLHPIKQTGVDRYYMVSIAEIERDVFVANAIRDTYKYVYPYLTDVCVKRSFTNALYVYGIDFCNTPNNYNLDIAEYFEDTSVFEKFRELLHIPYPYPFPTLQYKFIQKPVDVFIPPTQLNDIFKTVQLKEHPPMRKSEYMQDTCVIG